MTTGPAMHPPPFEYVAFMVGTNDGSLPEPVITFGFAIGMTIDTEGYVWLYVEPANAYHPVMQVPIIHCRRCCPPEVSEYGNVRRRTLAELSDASRAKFATPTDATPTQDSHP